MGRQTLFHMAPEDMKAFLQWVQEREPVVVTRLWSDSREVLPVADPLAETHPMTLWNQTLLPTLERRRISGDGHHGIELSLPTLELSPSRIVRWNGQAGMVQGRVYGWFDKVEERYARWYEGIARWIRSRFERNPIPTLRGYIGPAALKWFHEGGILLPLFEPPVTEEWVRFVDEQKQHRGDLLPPLP